MKPHNSTNHSLCSINLFATELSDLFAAEIIGGTALSLEASASTNGDSIDTFMSSANVSGAEMSFDKSISVGKEVMTASGATPAIDTEILGLKTIRIGHGGFYRFKCKDLKSAKEFFNFFKYA